MQTPAVSSAMPHMKPAAVKMGSAATHVASEVAANAAKYTVGGGYWARLGAVLGSTIPAGLGGSLIGGLTGGLSSLFLAAESAAGLGGLTGAVSGLGLIPVAFKHLGSRLLKVVPKTL